MPQQTGRIQMPVLFGRRTDNHRRLIHNILSAPDLDAHDDAPILQQHGRRHAIVAEAVILRIRNDLIIPDAALGFSLPGLPAIERSDDDGSRTGESVDHILAGGDVHLNLTARKLKHRRLPATAPVDRPGLRPAPTSVGTGHDPHAAILIRMGKIVVSLFVSPLIGQ